VSDDALSQPDPVEAALARTPARVLVGRSGPAYRTATWLQLRADHAVARDAVQAEVDLLRDFGAERVTRFGLFEARSRAASKAEHLRRPDLGRKFAPESLQAIRANCPLAPDLQVVIGDGLSAMSVAAHAPELLTRFHTACAERGWTFGRPFLVRYCRVGLMNDVGDLLGPAVVVLLIGERPGLATADSLSAYLAYRPRAGHTDADRNLVSNIHDRGVDAGEAVRRVMALTERFRALGRSGVGITDDSPQLSPARPQATSDQRGED
jgi:ethanolamine ammonia-lyase small subunit